MREKLHQIAKQVLKAACGLSDVQVALYAKRGALVRFTNNGVHQNGFQDLFAYTLRALTSEGPVWVESNDASPAGIQAASERLKLLTEGLDSGPAHSTESAGSHAEKFFHKKEYFSFRLQQVPEMASRTIEKAIRVIRKENASANGYYSAYERFFYLMDSKGLEIFHPSTAYRLGVTVTKGAGKGYFSFYHPDPRKMAVEKVVREAMGLAREAAAGEVSLEGGEYECVFSPRAFLELIEPLRRHFDGPLTESGKSVFSGLLGQKIFSKAFSLYEDLSYPGQFGVPFDAEGLPRTRVPLVEKGVLTALLGKGHSTRGIFENPVYPQNLVVSKGESSCAEIFRRIRRGIYINKIWYHTLVHESEMEVTGLATAGSVYIEKGRVKGRVIGLRYHDSLFSILRSLKATSHELVLLKDGERGAALFPYLWVSRLKVVT